jgi:hypothetical protein
MHKTSRGTNNGCEAFLKEKLTGTGRVAKNCPEQVPKIFYRRATHHREPLAEL